MSPRTSLHATERRNSTIAFQCCRTCRGHNIEIADRELRFFVPKKWHRDSIQSGATLKSVQRVGPTKFQAHNNLSTAHREYLLYLDAESNGLSYVIDKVKNNPLFAHITLEKGERSELANLANELL